MSSILYDIYEIDLGDRLSAVPVGIQIIDELVNNLMLADDVLACAMVHLLKKILKLLKSW